MKKDINIQINTSYHTLNELTEHTKNIWVVCHGYGQLAEYFIQKFACLPPQENFIIAPQALSKFYISGFSGRVGATWMTKRDRETEVGNYVNMISNIFARETQGADLGKYRVILFGFSQGTATITRFAMQSGIHFHHLILWAGSFPHDANFEEASGMLSDKKFDFLMGNQDEFYNQKRIDEHIAMLKEQNIYPQLTIFEGEHKVYDDVLLNLDI